MDSDDCCTARTEDAAQVPELCPRCGTRGQPVPAATISSLVRSAVRSRLASLDGYRFCSEPRCGLAYFKSAAGAQIPRAALRVRVGAQETTSPRTLCYCFDHTFEQLATEVRATGTSVVPDSIAAQCKLGLDRCDETNPKGSCCLGEVRAEVRRLQGAVVSPRRDRAQ